MAASNLNFDEKHIGGTGPDKRHKLTIRVHGYCAQLLSLHIRHFTKV